MQVNIEFNNKSYHINFNEPIDISLPIQSGEKNPNAFGIPHPVFEPIHAGSFIGSVAQGGSVNCENLFINAHGNGTHTECVGHISREKITINQTLKQFMFMAQIITVPIKTVANNHVVLLDEVVEKVNPSVAALIIRTTPNADEKLNKNYSGNNPPYLQMELCEWLCKKGVEHLIIDLPSVDPEFDDGKLSAHHAFWNYPNQPRMQATITEMAYIPNHIADGIYLLNLQIASLETDASPSKPVLYKLNNVL